MICPKCGQPINDGARFCSICGTELNQPVWNMYPQPEPFYNVPSVPGKGLGIASMVLGIISLALFCLWYLTIPCAIVGIVLGGVAYSKAKQMSMSNGMAVAGIVCACIALGLALLFILLIVIGITSSVYYY